MKILVTGVAGQLGYDVVAEARGRGIEAVGIDLADLDLTDEIAVQQYFTDNDDFQAIIHCAAYTNVDRAEDEPDVAHAVNVAATKYLVKAAHAIGAKFMYISTDYVYGGNEAGVLQESQPTVPVSVYGKTKLAGEHIVQMLPAHFIVRTAWVFGYNGNNFVKTMLRLGEQQQQLRVVADQVGSPTYTADLAKLLLTIVQTDKYGIYQATNEGFCSWYDFAVEIFQQAGKRVEVVPVTSDAYPTKAERPKNSRMSKDKLVENGFERLPAWQDALSRYLQLIGQYANNEENDKKGSK
jgi:dTDP-4-dehydrorhamnose reductase